MMTKLDEPFRGVYVYFKSSVEKLIPIHHLLLRKLTDTMGHDVVSHMNK